MNNFTIQKTETIKRLEKIESNGDEIICIVNKSNKLIGIATDGDIRRKLLDGITLINQLVRVCVICLSIKQ